MARTRNLKPAFFKNEFLGQLPFEARILYQGLWCIADRRGVLEDRPLRIKAEVFPFDNVDVDALLSQLSTPIDAFQDHPFIVRYESNGKRYILIPKFEEHQTPHHQEKPSDAPLPQDVCPQEVTKNPEQALDKPWISSVQALDKPRTNPSLTLNPSTLTLNPQTDAPAAASGEAGDDQDSVPKKRKPKADASYTDEFLTFWDVYPSVRKSKKRDAFDSWRKLSEADRMAAMEGAREYAQTELGRGEYSQTPVHWLNQRRWEDDRKSWGRKVSQSTGGHTRRPDFEQWRAALVKRLRSEGKPIPGDDELREAFEEVVRDKASV